MVPPIAPLGQCSLAPRQYVPKHPRAGLLSASMRAGEMVREGCHKQPARGRKCNRPPASIVLPKRFCAWADPILSRYPGNHVLPLLTSASLPPAFELLPGPCPAWFLCLSPLLEVGRAEALLLDVGLANDVTQLYRANSFFGCPSALKSCYDSYLHHHVIIGIVEAQFRSAFGQLKFLYSR